MMFSLLCRARWPQCRHSGLARKSQTRNLELVGRAQGNIEIPGSTLRVDPE
jgi:hypothetical protein